MTRERNPFTPTFGEIPAHLAGRRALMEGFERAFSDEGRRPELTTIISGARGTGKTTMLSLLSESASDWGWMSVDVTAHPGLLEDIEIQLAQRATQPSTQRRLPRLKGLGIPGLMEVEFTHAPEHPRSNWRSRMGPMIDWLNNAGIGLLITVDELDPTLDEVVELVTVYQHFVREHRRVALVAAGLSSHIDSLLNGRSSSFLRRAQQERLGRIDDSDIESAFRQTIEDGGRFVEEGGLSSAVEAIEGFPYLMQLVGFRAWDADPGNPLITRDAIATGIRQGRSELHSRIYDATLRELSGNDRRFLRAMLPDGEVSAIGDLRSRLGWSSSLVSQYRRRLIDAGVIGSRGRGVVAFELPFFREFLDSDGRP